jgi:hypothetical protein
MKKIILSICCLISIDTLAQYPIERVQSILEKAKSDNTFEHCFFRIGDIIYDNKEVLSEDELNKIFEIQKNYLGITSDSYEPVLHSMWYVYTTTKNNILKNNILYLAEQAINDTIIDYVQRNNISRLFINGVDLHIFDKKMKDEIVKNLNFTYKDDKHYMLNTYMILLAGALEMKELKDKLQVIADSANIYSERKYTARIALCRMGNKEMLKKYFTELQSMSLKDVIRRYWNEIEYIKQKESIDILLKILYSEETEPSAKETLPDEKIAYYAMKAIERIASNCPIKVQTISGYERDKYLEKMRIWAKKNRIKINRNVW